MEMAREFYSPSGKPPNSSILAYHSIQREKGNRDIKIMIKHLDFSELDDPGYGLQSLYSMVSGLS